MTPRHEPARWCVYVFAIGAAAIVAALLISEVMQ